MKEGDVSGQVISVAWEVAGSQGGEKGLGGGVGFESEDEWLGEVGSRAGHVERSRIGLMKDGDVAGGGSRDQMETVKILYRLCCT